MMSQIRRNLETFFKRKMPNPEEDGSDDNSGGEYWEFIDPDEVEFWSLELIPMSDSTHFMPKLKISPIFLPILNDEKIREVLYENPGRVNILCETTTLERYVFTISIDYAKAPFHLTHFLKSIENSSYEAFLKEIKEQVDKKMWLNKEGLPLNAKSMASKVRQVLISIATMSALNKRFTQDMRAIDLTDRVMSQGSALPGPEGTISILQGGPVTRSRVLIPAMSKRQQAGGSQTQAKRMRSSRIEEMGTTSVVTEVPSNLELGGKIDYLETKTMYEKF
jgi:hypothetical protein